MPGGDGTGPAGMGSMTGRAAGYCAGYSVPGYMNPLPGRGWFGRGGGWGRGRGFGRGFDRPWRAYPYAYGVPYYGVPYGVPYSGGSYGYGMTRQQEADMLEEQAKAMQEEIESINERVKELESAEKD
ncbi:MAG: DUF5320 domain-containing protein [Candidatus Omnitrophota bacterium]|nr:DUF5320 domain-containing protein [Candidatus Omnitrophota bacterium]